MIFNETSFTQVSSSLSLLIDSKALVGLGLYIAQVWRLLRHTYTHTHTHTTGPLPILIGQSQGPLRVTLKRDKPP